MVVIYAGRRPVADVAGRCWSAALLYCTAVQLRWPRSWGWLWTDETDLAQERAVMQGRSASRAGAGFGAAERVAGRVGARPAGLCDALMRRGWGALTLMTPLNSGIRLSFRQTDPSFSGNAELVDKEDGDDARTACPLRRLVGQRRRTAPQR
jgi:hypothetical protein